MSKNVRSRIGLTKNLKIKTNKNNTFVVYGESIGSDNPYGGGKKDVKVESVHHKWDYPPTSVVDLGPHELQITAFCHPRHSNSDDDLTVTITLDPATSSADMTLATFPDVEYDD